MTKTIPILCQLFRSAYSPLGKGDAQYDREIISLSLYSSQFLHKLTRLLHKLTLLLHNLTLDLDNQPLDFHNRHLAAFEGGQK